MVLASSAAAAIAASAIACSIAAFVGNIAGVHAHHGVVELLLRDFAVTVFIVHGHYVYSVFPGFPLRHQTVLHLRLGNRTAVVFVQLAEYFLPNKVVAIRKAPSCGVAIRTGCRIGCQLEELFFDRGSKMSGTTDPVVGPHIFLLAPPKRSREFDA